MKLLFSVPTGYHVRELLLPLSRLLEADASIDSVICVTPAAPFKDQLFASFSSKFTFIANPDSDAGHEDILRGHLPDMVITNTVGHDEKDYPILKAAETLHIPTLTFIASWDNVWKIERLLKLTNRVALANNFIVWNTMMKDHMLRIFPTLDPARIAIIGAPRFDYYAHTDRIPSKEQLYQALGLEDVSQPLIHFSTTELYPMDYLTQAISQAKKSGRIPEHAHLLATVHPGGNLNRHTSLESYGVHVRYAFGREEQAPLPAFTYNPSEENIYNSVALYRHSSLLINHSSTTALESLLADVPVINVKYGKPLDWWHWYRSMVYRDFEQHYKDVISDGATQVVKNKKQLVKATAMYLKHPDIDRQARHYTIKKMITNVDGTASEEVISHIKSLL